MRQTVSQHLSYIHPNISLTACILVIIDSGDEIEVVAHVFTIVGKFSIQKSVTVTGSLLTSGIRIFLSAASFGLLNCTRVVRGRFLLANARGRCNKFIPFVAFHDCEPTLPLICFIFSIYFKI